MTTPQTLRALRTRGGRLAPPVEAASNVPRLPWCETRKTESQSPRSSTVVCSLPVRSAGREHACVNVFVPRVLGSSAAAKIQAHRDRQSTVLGGLRRRERLERGAKVLLRPRLSAFPSKSRIGSATSALRFIVAMIGVPANLGELA